MSKNSSKLIYFDKKQELTVLFKKLLNFKTRKIWAFQNINFSYFKKTESEKCHICSWEYTTSYWLIKEHNKTAEKGHVAYFIS